MNSKQPNQPQTSVVAAGVTATNQCFIVNTTSQFHPIDDLYLFTGPFTCDEKDKKLVVKQDHLLYPHLEIEWLAHPRGLDTNCAIS
jgi:hypothetical protein